MAERWLPLESNPDVMNPYLRHLGLDKPWGLCDIMSLDVDEAVHVPQPSLAVILLLPITEKYTKFVTEQQAEMEEIQMLPPDGADFEVYYMKQTIPNACGTIALIHAIANNLNELRPNIRPNSIVTKFLKDTMQETPEGRARILEESVEIANLHDDGAKEGQSEAPDNPDDTDLHFITIVNIGDRVIELDGRKDGPVFHGITTRERFLQDAFKVCQKYISIDPYNLKYNALSLSWMDIDDDDED